MCTFSRFYSQTGRQKHHRFVDSNLSLNYVNGENMFPSIVSVSNTKIWRILKGKEDKKISSTSLNK